MFAKNLTTDIASIVAAEARARVLPDQDDKRQANRCGTPDCTTSAGSAHRPGGHATASPCGDTLPIAPLHLKDMDVAPEMLTDLTLKLACSVPSFTTQWAANKLCLALGVVTEVLEDLRRNKCVDIRGQKGPLNYEFAVTHRGMDRGSRLQQISSYIGAAPVALDSYVTKLKQQLSSLPDVTDGQVAESLGELVLPELAVKVAGLAMSSRRSLLVFGPPGNGKTSLGRFLHRTVSGQIWIPQTVAVGDHLIRIFDSECHRTVTPELSADRLRRLDHRWVCIERPFIMVGGELTLADLELGYSPSLGCYEAPVHIKANGGTFLLDDLGCQREEPERLLKRWFVPLDQKLDYLTLQTGQKICIPFELMLIISTNLEVNEVMTPAVLRRMGYRLLLDNPTAGRYRDIFMSYAKKCGCTVSSETLGRLLARYTAEQRPLRGCEPHDLIERARDICRFEGRVLDLDDDVLDLAWQAYFSQS